MSLIGVSVIASRLLFVYCLITFALYYGFKTDIRVNLKFIISLILIFLGIFILTYLRTKGFYLKNYGLGFFGAGFSEIITYLGTPIQGTLSLANNILERGVVDIESFYKYSTIERSLTTNSAFVQIIIKDGLVGLIKFFFIGIFYGYLAGIFVKYRGTVLYFSYSAIMYSYLEIWRTSIFTGGVIITLISIPIVIFLIIPFFKRGVR